MVLLHAFDANVLEECAVESDCEWYQYGSSVCGSDESFVFLFGLVHHYYSSVGDGYQTLHSACSGHFNGLAYLGQAGTL